MIQEVTPQILFLALLLVTLLAPALTLVVSAVLLRRYRRAVARAMAASAEEAGALSDPATSERPNPDARAVASPARATETWLRRETLHGPLREAARYAVAGVAFAVTTALVYLVEFRFRFALLPLLVWCWLFAWPVVVTVNLIVPSTWRMKAASVVAYFAVLTILALLAALTPNMEALQLGAASLPAWSMFTPRVVVALWCVLNLPATLLLLAFLNRRVRAVGPLMLSFMMIATTGAVIAWFGMFYASEAVIALTVRLGVSVVWTLLAGVAGAFLLFGALGWLAAVWIRRAYQRKAVSDLSLMLDAVWLLFATCYAITLAAFALAFSAAIPHGGRAWMASGLLGFPVYAIVARIAHRGASAPGAPATTLLFLRVFSLGVRSERMFDAVARHWRHVGSVQFITGHDLATATVGPHQFLEYLSGRLSGLFIGSPGALERSMRLLDTRPDADCRFRINHFFCFRDSWPEVLRRLVDESRVVLMDLRSFTKRNDGCVLELGALVDAVPIGRLVLVVDENTDRDFLDRTLEGFWRTLRADSPNRGASPAAVRPIHVESLGDAERRRLIERLCAAAGTSGAVTGHRSDGT
jgi:hypothetical protein